MELVQHKHYYKCWHCARVNEFVSSIKSNGELLFGGKGASAQKATPRHRQSTIYVLQCAFCQSSNQVIVAE